MVGETPNLAARLQGLASPNSVVIATSTRSLIGERFDCENLGTYPLHGFSEPVRAWRVVASRFAGSRFEAAQRVRSVNALTVKSTCDGYCGSGTTRIKAVDG